jgi:hypothetical protein
LHFTVALKFAIGKVPENQEGLEINGIYQFLVYVDGVNLLAENIYNLKNTKGRGVNLTTHLHLVLRSRMCGAIPPLLQYVFMGWCLVKHRRTSKNTK